MGRFTFKRNNGGYEFTFSSKQSVVLHSCRSFSCWDDCMHCLHSLIQNIALPCIEDHTCPSSSPIGNPKFEILENGEKYYFLYRNENGERLAQSVHYPTKLDCINAIDSVIKSIYPII